MHKCPAPECKVSAVPDDMLACRKDWFRLPQSLRNRVTSSWRRGEGEGSEAHGAAVRAALAWYKDNHREPG